MGKFTIMFRISATKHPDVLVKVAEIVGANVRRYPEKPRYDHVKFQGSKLEHVFDTLWPFLAESRKIEYILKLRERDARNEALDIELKRRADAQKLAALRASPAMKRMRDEARYRNDDPAVQVVDDYLNVDYVSPARIQAILDQLTAERAKAEALLIDPLGNHETRSNS